MNEIIDLRSDTVTLPTEEMKKAIANAKLGDDVFQEDPTVNELEKKAAEIMGKDAGLLGRIESCLREIGGYSGGENGGFNFCNGHNNLCRL